MAAEHWATRWTGTTMPMPHSVCLAEIADLNAWLLRVLA